MKCNNFLSNIFSFETTFVLFLIAGGIQAMPLFSPIGQVIHATTIFGGISILTGIIVLLMNKGGVIKRKKLQLFLVFAIFTTYAIASYFNTLGFEKADRKFLEFIFIVPWTIFASLIIINNKKRAFRFLVLLFIFGIIISLTTIYSVLTKDYSIIKKATDYHRLGTSAGASLLLCIIFFTYQKKWAWKFIIICSLGITTLGLFFSANRSGFLAAIITLFILLITHLKKKTKHKNNNILKKSYLIGLFLFIIIISSILLSFSSKAQYMIYRLEAKNPMQSRLLMYKESIKVWTNYPIFGVGIGGFSKITGLHYRQPHNMFLELLSEFGIIGFILFNIYIFYWLLFIKKTKIKQDIILLSLVTLFIFYFLNAMVSGDITDNRLFLALTGVLTSIIITKREEQRRFNANQRQITI